MSQPRSRWFLNIVLVLGAVAFVGFSMLPLFETVIKESQPVTEATPAASQSPIVQQKTQQANEAREYELVLQQEPNNQTALQGLVNARIKQGDLEGAIAPLEKLTELNPQDFRPLLVKARILKQQGKTAEADALFKQAADLAPPEAQAQIKQLSTQPSAPKQGNGEAGKQESRGAEGTR